MIHDDISQHVDSLLERGERIAWTGRSSPTAFLASHIPILIFTMAFAIGSAGATKTSLAAVARLDFSSFGLFQSLFMLMAALSMGGAVLAVVRDTNVAWAVSDRRVYKLRGGSVTATELHQIAAVEVRPRADGGGSIIVNLPEYKDRDGEKQRPSVSMLGLDDLQGAHRALVAVQRRNEGQIRI